MEEKKKSKEYMKGLEEGRKKEIDFYQPLLSSAMNKLIEVRDVNEFLIEHTSKGELEKILIEHVKMKSKRIDFAKKK